MINKRKHGIVIFHEEISEVIRILKEMEYFALSGDSNLSEVIGLGKK